MLPGDGGLKRRGYELESGRVGKCTDQTPWACLRLKVMNLVMGDGGVVSPATSSYVPGEGSRPRADLDQGCLLLGKPKVGSCGVCPRLLVTTTKCQLERKGDDDEPRLDLTTPKLCDLRKKSLNLSFLFHKMGTQGPISTRLWSLKDDLGGQMFWPIRGPGHSGCERCLTRGPCAQMWTEHPRAAPAQCEAEPSTGGHPASPSSSPPAEPRADTHSPFRAPVRVSDAPTNKPSLAELGCRPAGPSRHSSAFLIARL